MEMESVPERVRSTDAGLHRWRGGSMKPLPDRRNKFDI